MAEPVILYNPRLQPLELHSGGQVVVVPPLGRIEHVRSGQVERLIVTGALQVIDRPPRSDDAPRDIDPAPVILPKRRTTRPQR